MNKKKKESKDDEKYCKICGVIDGAEPFGVRCQLPKCPRNKKKK